MAIPPTLYTIPLKESAVNVININLYYSPEIIPGTINV